MPSPARAPCCRAFFLFVVAAPLVACGLDAGLLNSGTLPDSGGANGADTDAPAGGDDVPAGDAKSPASSQGPNDAQPVATPNAVTPSAGNTNVPTVPATPAKVSCPTFPNYTLAWSDLFDGSALDASKWSYEVNCDGGGNDEAQCYVQSPSNLFVQDGRLTIRVRKGGASSGKTFTSARITTRNKGDFKYGKFLARLKAVKGKGLWPAFWMMPTDSVYGPWPTSGELDIMEVLGSAPAKLYGTPHFGTPSKHLYPGGTFTLANADFSEGFHDFAMERTATQVTWSVDGNVYWTLKASDNQPWQTSTGKWPFDQKFFFILNMAIGGNFGGAIDPSITQADYVVEHVCAYQ